MVIGNASANAWAALLGSTGTVTLRPGACRGVMTGPADAMAQGVTTSTGGVLDVANSAGGTGVPYDVVIVGMSA
ncbi:hypothetical protein GCM10018785_05370 [Streptomyces longispororuber]|uniref:Uncharacterized protein n=1 Tax=Streptomyces longispororuber TaxID=68230 RepID=A0A919DEF1_9ACTN|nr:hypothetical protein [Streptomyces longispororuber]GHE38752.1 hypothetical protein GCM10018785_05370 [Streptomyces longispororuber]